MTNQEIADRLREIQGDVDNLKFNATPSIIAGIVDELGALASDISPATATTPTAPLDPPAEPAQ